MYTPSNRSLSCAVAAIFVAALLTVATVGPAYAATGDKTAPCAVAAKTVRPILQ